MRPLQFCVATLIGFAVSGNIVNAQTPASRVDPKTLNRSMTTALIDLARQQHRVTPEMQTMLSYHLSLTTQRYHSYVMEGFYGYQYGQYKPFDARELERQKLAEVTALLELGADPNVEREDDQYSPLYYTVQYKWSSVARRLLQSGADPLKRYHDNWHIVNSGMISSLPMLKAFVETGTNPFLRDSYGRTLLMNAAIHGSSDSCDYLLRLGVNPNLRDKYGYTALYFAAGSGNSEKVRTLLKYGADPRATVYFPHSGIHSSVLDAAAQECDLKSLRLLVAHLPRPFVKQHASAALRSALSIQVVEGIILKKYRWHIAETVNYLIQQGGDVNAKGWQGDTALMLCVQNMRAAGTNTVALCLPTLALLGLHGARINDANDHGETALMEAAEIGRWSPTEWLLEHGAQPNQRDKKGKTALIHLVERAKDASFLTTEDESVIGLLRHHGADSNIKDNAGNTAIDIARRNKQKGLLDALTRKLQP